MQENLNIIQDQTFNYETTLLSGTVPFNLSGFSVTGKIRYYYSATGYHTNFSCVAVSEESGIVNLNLSSEVSAILAVGTWPYDICVYKQGESYRPLNGYVIVYPTITPTPIIEESPPV